MVESRSEAGEAKQGEGAEGAAESVLAAPETKKEAGLVAVVAAEPAGAAPVETKPAETRTGPAFPPVKRVRRIIDMRRPRPAEGQAEEAPATTPEASRPGTETVTAAAQGAKPSIESAKPAASVKAPVAASAPRADAGRG